MSDNLDNNESSEKTLPDTKVTRSQGEDDKLSVRDFLDRDLKEFKAPAFEEDKEFYRKVACYLGFSAILSLFGIIGLASFDKPIPESLVALGSASISAIAVVFTGARRH